MVPTLLYVLAALGAIALVVWALGVALPAPRDVLPENLSAPDPPSGGVMLARSLAISLARPVVEGNRAELLVNGDRFFPAMLRAIGSARQSVNLLSYLYWSGEIAREFAAALSSAARRGVAVRVLVDAYGARFMPEAIAEQLEAAGCRFARFHPLRWYSVRRINNRTHRRALIVDGRFGFTGGAGIATEWTGDAQDSDHWRDNHFRLDGPIVHHLQAAFAENWRQATGEVLTGDAMYPELEPAGAALAVPVNSSPHGEISDIAFLYWLSLRSARARARITTPYFVPDRSLLTAIVAASERGVDVQILVPGDRNDSRLVRHASLTYYRSLLEAGVRVFEYEPTMMHAKALTVDECWNVIGSPNFDHRSLELNYETALAVVDEILTTALNDRFDADRSRSREITLRDLPSRLAPRNLRNHLSLILKEQI